MVIALIAYFLGNMSAKYYENPIMLSRVTANNVGDVFFETHCRLRIKKFPGMEGQLFCERLPRS